MQSLVEMQRAPAVFKILCALKYLCLELCFLVLLMSCPSVSPINSGTFDIDIGFVWVYIFLIKQTTSEFQDSDRIVLLDQNF